MCGIAGMLGSAREVVSTATGRATDALAHRGPDDYGVEIQAFGSEWVGLGHRRLSILDLSPLGHQPMAHPASECWLILNGEIYNFQQLRTELQRECETFRGGSDTEVLLAGLARHGDQFLQRLEGMYAFALYDPRGPFLLLARDPAGIKPLYLAEGKEYLVFASEVRAVLATGLVTPHLDRRGVAGFLAYGAVQHPLTLFRGVSSLPPGSFLKFHIGPAGRWERAGPPRLFWRLPCPQPDVTEDQAVDRVRDTLDAAVKSHLVADVPVGLFLSSGLDSTILAGLAAQNRAGLRSFTVTFADQPDFSESKLAAESAKRFGLDHTEIPMPIAEAEAEVVDWLLALDQPSIDGLNVFLISRAVREQGIKVALSGLGGDELFGGYPSFRDVPRLRRMMRLLGPLPSWGRRGLAETVTIGQSGAVRAKLRDMFASDGLLRSLYLHRRRAMSDSQIAALGLCCSDLGLGPDFLPADAAPDVDADETDPVRVISQLEFRLYQGNMLLRDADSNGMKFGLEIRVPLLDQKLLNLALAIPGPIRVPPRSASKYLLRRAFVHLLRPEILAQAKRGFTLPIRRWMVGPLRSLCEGSLAALKDVDILRPEGIDSVWQGFLAEPESPLWTRAFTLCVLGSFVQKTNATA